MKSPAPAPGTPASRPSARHVPSAAPARPAAPETARVATARVATARSATGRRPRPGERSATPAPAPAAKGGRESTTRQHRRQAAVRKPWVPLAVIGGVLAVALATWLIMSRQAAAAAQVDLAAKEKALRAHIDSGDHRQWGESLAAVQAQLARMGDAERQRAVLTRRLDPAIDALLPELLALLCGGEATAAEIDPLVSAFGSDSTREHWAKIQSEAKEAQSRTFDLVVTSGAGLSAEETTTLKGDLLKLLRKRFAQIGFIRARDTAAGNPNTITATIDVQFAVYQAEGKDAVQKQIPEGFDLTLAVASAHGSNWDGEFTIKARQQAPDVIAPKPAAGAASTATQATRMQVGALFGQVESKILEMPAPTLAKAPKP